MTRKQLIIETTSVVISVVFMLTAWILGMVLQENGWYVVLFYALAFRNWWLC